MKNPSFRGFCMADLLVGRHRQRRPRNSKPPPARRQGPGGRAVPSVSRRGPLGRRLLRLLYAEQLRFSCRARYHTRFRRTRRSPERLRLKKNTKFTKLIESKISNPKTFL